MKKTTIIGIAGAILCVLVFLGGCLYFVVGVSSTFPPIKKYQCAANVSQLITGLKKYASKNTDMIVDVTDTVGNSDSGYAIDLDLKMVKDNHRLEYTLRCKNEDTLTSKVALIFAYDATTLTGGYGDKATGIRVIIKHFDENFLIGFQKSQNIKLTVIKPTFLDPLKHAWNGE